MIKLIRKLGVVVVMMAALSTGAFAQGRDKDKNKLPPKQPVRVIDGKGGSSRPPQPPPKPPKEDRGKKRP